MLLRSIIRNGLFLKYRVSPPSPSLTPLIKQTILYQSTSMNMKAEKSNIHSPSRGQTNLLGNKICAYFTSSSNPSQVPLLQEIQAKILQIIKQCKPSLLTSNKANLERNTKFETLGIDSLEVMEIVVAMEESFGLELSDEQALKIHSLGTAIDIFFSKINARIMNKMVERSKEEVLSTKFRQQ